MSEGVALRHLCDWALFVGKEQNRIDWDRYYVFCREFGFDRFAYAFTDLAHRYLGMEIRNPKIILDDRYSDRILQDIIAADSRVYSSGKGAWAQRLALVRKMFKDSWKYHCIARKSVLLHLAKTVWGFVFKLE